jgi:hypothetical protein
MKLREMDERTTYLEQLQGDDGRVVLINQFEVPPEGVVAAPHVFKKVAVPGICTS